MYDPPHLLKNIRNNLKNHGYTIETHDINWQHINDFYEADISKPILMAPRLSKKHVDLPPFAALRVSLASLLHLVWLLWPSGILYQVWFKKF